MIKIGTRASHLARTQALLVEKKLNDIGIETKIVIITTEGDRNLNRNFSEIGSQGIFVKELEQSLLKQHIDIAVHSAKDLPIQLDQKLQIGAYLKREDPADILLSFHEINENVLKSKNLTIGTSSIRRSKWIGHFYPHINVEGLRGNVPTRIKALENIDVIILAKAGMDRLNKSPLSDKPNIDLKKLHMHRLDPNQFVSAPGQGAIAIECLKASKDILDSLNRINHKETQTCIDHERIMLGHLSGGCNVPLGVYVKMINQNNSFEMHIAHALNNKFIKKTFQYNQINQVEEKILQELKS